MHTAMMLTLHSAGRITNYEIVNHPYAHVATSGSYRDLKDRPTLTRFATTGNVIDIDDSVKHALNPVLARGSASVDCDEPDACLTIHHGTPLPYIVQLTPVGCDFRPVVTSRRDDHFEIRCFGKRGDETGSVDWVVLSVA
jgi:hypothetical protein